jgi:hypothetical protein
MRTRIEPVTVDLDAELAERLRCIVLASGGYDLPLRAVVHALLVEAASHYERGQEARDT